MAGLERASGEDSLRTRRHKLKMLGKRCTAVASKENYLVGSYNLEHQSELEWKKQN